MDDFLREVRATLDQITELPDDAEKPELERLKTRFPVISMSLYGDVAASYLYEVADEAKRRLQQITGVANVGIAGDREAVFDLTTTARFWPLWHPASMLMAGVTERPYRLGDRIRERGQVGPQAFQATWTVAEYERPSHVVLESEGASVRITYSFKPGEEATVFTRKLQYNARELAVSDLTPDDLNRGIKRQSEQAVNQLKAFVEKILRTEKLGLD